ncbi:WcaG Nucleoside-diphosphate-sugar epimerases [Comamonadaceae bacterium]
MSNIAIVGASSQIAKDLILSFTEAGRKDLLLYVRDIEATHAWVLAQNLEAVCSVHGYESYGGLPHDVVINFVGVGDPRRAAEMGASIFEITTRFDDMVLADLARNPSRRYLFLSSGAAYGNAFAEPVTASTQAAIAINNIQSQDYYATAKLHAEVRHRARPDLAIIDIRVFNMFSRTQDIEARFFITDIVRAIRDERTLQTSADYMVRDFMHPDDFHRLVECLVAAPRANCAVDCYSREPIDKPALLQAMAERFGLRYEVVGSPIAAVNATGAKPHYYSLNRKAAEFGYQPARSSLEGIVAEAAAILNEDSAVYSMGKFR